MVIRAAEQWKPKLLAFWQKTVKPILLIVIVLTTFRSAIADWNDVPTGSMNPTIIEGDRIFVNKLAYDLKVPFTTWHIAEWGGPERGDVVVFYGPDDGTRLVKRVVGVPGDVLEMRNSRLWVNGVAATYAAAPVELAPPGGSAAIRRTMMEQIEGEAHPVMITPRRPARRTFEAVKVPEGSYFVMGDNRDNSRDSRWFGFVDRDSIVGRASWVALSVDRERCFLPRWDRFGRRLP